MWWPFGKIKKIKCPDGTERLVYKDPEDAFPFFAKDWSTKFDSMLKATQEIQGKLGASCESNINGFFTQLDQANRSIQIHFRAIYVLYTVNPCANDKLLVDEIKKAIDNESIMRRMQYEIDFINGLLVNNAPPDSVILAIKSSSQKLSRPLLEQKASAAFEKAQEDVASWEGENSDN